MEKSCRYEVKRGDEWVAIRSMAELSNGDICRTCTTVNDESVMSEFLVKCDPGLDEEGVCEVELALLKMTPLDGTNKEV